MPKYPVAILLVFSVVVMTKAVDARSVKKCTSTDGTVTYATSCPSDSTASEETLNIYDTESPDPGNNPNTAGVGDESGGGSGDGAGGVTVVGGESGQEGTSGSTGGGASGGGSAGGGSAGGGSAGGTAGGGAAGGESASSSDGGESGDGSASETAAADTTTESSSSSSSPESSSPSGPTGSSTSSPSGSTSNAPAGTPSSTSSSESETASTDEGTSGSSSAGGSSGSGGSTSTTVEVQQYDDDTSAPNYTVNTITNDSVAKEIIISGSNFGSGPNVILFDTFQNGTTGAGVPLTNLNNPACKSDTDGLGVELVAGPLKGCWDEYQDAATKPVYYDIGHSGAHSMSTFEGPTGTMLQIRKNLADINEIFVSFWVQVPPGKIFPGKNWWSVPKPATFSKDSSWKFTWLHDGGHDTKIANISIPTYTGLGNFYISGNDLNIITGLKANDFWSWDYWNRFATWLKANPSNPTGPGKTLFQAVSLDKGFYEASSDTAPIHDEDGPSPKKFSQINFPGWIRDSSSANTVTLYDDIYIATGPNAVSRVELGNSDNYYNNTKLVIQPATDWSDGEIRIATDADIFTSFGGTKYLYITDSEGKVNINGFPVP